MSLIGNGIDSVRAFVLPAGIRGDGSTADLPFSALVRWRSVLKGLLYQVYVDGRYAGTTIDSEQRQMIVPIPSRPDGAVRIEVFAVKAALADIDYSSELAGRDMSSGRVRITLLVNQDLPKDTTAEVYFDNGTGQIDYDTPISTGPIRLWPLWQDKAGFGMSVFGRGDFGYDGAAAIGLGKGSFGLGRFGCDADIIEWISPVLEGGIYRFAVVVIDGAGSKSIAAETGPVTVTPSAKPAGALAVDSYDRQENNLVLRIL